MNWILRGFKPRYAMKFSLKRNFKSSSIDLVKGILKQDRVSLSRAITLIESQKKEHKEEANYVLEQVTPQAYNLQNKMKSIRIGITGPPGAGKSTFVEAFGDFIINSDKTNKVAVLAIDPSSNRTGGSILGDKTRMDKLSTNSSAFVRPTPTKGKLGGIAQHTGEVITLCEASQYNVIIVETVGLGQSEVVIDDVVDFVILLTPPQMGDDLQGVKKGIMEIADTVVVNKCDGDLVKIAKHAAIDYKHTFQLLRRKHSEWKPRVHMTSALHGKGIEDVWKTCQQFRHDLDDQIKKRREEQKVAGLWNAVFDEMQLRATRNSRMKAYVQQKKDELLNGNLTLRKAAKNIVDEYKHLANDESKIR